jgi:hypothetical protein
MSGWTSLSSFGSTKESNKFKSVSSITELASFLQVIRSLQDRLQAKRRGPNRGTKAQVNVEGATSGGGGSKIRPIVELPSDAVTQITTDLENVASGGSTEQARTSLGPQDVPSVVPTTALVATTVSSGTAPPWDFSVGSGEDVKGHGSTLLESAGEMFARWESMDVDVENVVRDALRAGRVPLAVVQLHRKRLKAFMSGSEEYRPEMVDVFQEVQDIGRAIVYEFLCKCGEASGSKSYWSCGAMPPVLVHLTLGCWRSPSSLRTSILAAASGAHTSLISTTQGCPELMSQLQQKIISIWKLFLKVRMQEDSPFNVQKLMVLPWDHGTLLPPRMMME